MQIRLAHCLMLFVLGLPTCAVAQGLSHWPDAGMRSGFEAADVGPYKDADAARFLTQATFGPTLEDIAHLRAVGYRNWLNEQFAAPVATQVPYLNWVEGLPPNPDGNNTVNDHTRMETWSINSVGTPDPSRGMVIPTDQLRQRMAFALSEIFVVSSKNGTLTYEPWALASYYDMLAANAFGNFRDLLEDVTLHPAMGIYLTHLANQKANTALNIRPDENYAREVLQLFSIGLVQLNTDGSPVLVGGQPVPTYSQATVTGFAAVFTGWNWNNTGCGPTTYVCCDENNYSNCGRYDHNIPSWKLPMQPVEAFHDSTSNKQLLDYPGVALPGGVLAAGGDATAELNAALDNIFEHPNVGPFIARRLIQRLVTSNPSAAYIQRVASVFNNNGSGVRGDLKAVLRAILLDSEARYGPWQYPSIFGKLREPLLKNTQLWRAMEARTETGRVETLSPYPGIEDWYGQGPLRSPSVFNFFQPDYRQSGEISSLALYSPEFQILTDSNIVSTNNRLFSLSFCFYTEGESCWTNGHGAVMKLNTVRDASLANSNPGALLDRYSLLLMSGQMSPFMHQTLLNRLNTLDEEPNRPLSRQRIQHALYLILNSPEYSIQK